jgi:hypothetical protein
VLGLPKESEATMRAAMVSNLVAVDRAAGDDKAPFVVNGAFTATGAGTTVKYAYVVDVMTRGGRPMHRINGHLAAGTLAGRSIWAPLEREAGPHIARMIVRDIVSRIAD